MTEVPDALQNALADRYRIEREIGSGGMATVYMARDLRHGRRVAIKVLRPDLATALGPDRFAREIEIAAALTHPHILPLHDSGSADGLLYYVMPYVEGESLRDWRSLRWAGGACWTDSPSSGGHGRKRSRRCLAGEGRSREAAELAFRVQAVLGDDPGSIPPRRAVPA
jgi:serine/threonine protein kinase